MPGPRLEQAASGVYYVHWTEGRRSKRISTRCKSLAEAKGFLATWMSLEQAEEKAAATLSCAAAWHAYWAGHVERGAVAAPERLDYAWKALGPHFGAVAVRDVTQATVDAYVAARVSGRLGRKVLASTVRKELQTLITAWHYAVKIKALPADDVPYVEIPPPPAPRDRWLTAAEIQTLLLAAELRRRGPRISRLERFLVIALHAAARRRAIETLKWDQVDFETDVIHFNPAGRRQTKKRRVSVPMSDMLGPVLRKAWQERVSEYVLDHPGSIRTAFDACVAAAGLEGVTRHTLRHTAATHMARNGQPMWTIAGVLGNSVRMVEGTYAKHAPDALTGAVNVLGALQPGAARTRRGVRFQARRPLSLSGSGARASRPPRPGSRPPRTEDGTGAE